MALEGKLGASFYEVLGVSKDCSEAEIRSAYRKLARKWHPDKWSKDPSHAEEAKARFQQIQEAYSVLSDDTKRAMYDAGVYDDGDDLNGFSDFLDEMATMMADTKTQNNKEDTFEDLQEMFTKMVNENWFSSGDTQQPEHTVEKDFTMQKQYPLCEINDLWNDGEDEWYDDDNEDDYTEDNWYSASSIQDHHSLEEKEQGIKFKKPRVSTSKGSGFEIPRYGAVDSYTSPTYVV
ncbi:hypothetical protein SUGI_0110940 [Cryptomeria japonica]|uniref:uncharacterized protein LOC131078820 n=1 Tax=Cryptomeria japonica TaxID=3369 RepID=UPI002408C49E|nr:uncharacterized protein LOC131078820 [Cryptomeria japonica]XP_057872582.1 uncharacterized protein LOC131078820 [Cryptomeria japonica]GLJ09511.1 hypothetical protein SUGI_0110940 [Cryptomeria japonica]